MTTQTPAQLFGKTLVDHLPAYLIGTFSMLVVSSSEALVPKFIQWTLDLLTAHGGSSAQLPKFLLGQTAPATLNNLAIAFLVMLAIGFVGRLGWRSTLARRTHEEAYFYKNRFWDAIRFQQLKFFHTYPLGDLMNRGTSDINRVRAIHGFSLVGTYDVLFFTVLSVIGMLMINVELTVLSLLIVPFLPRAMNKINRLEYALHMRAQNRLSKLADVIAQALATIRLQRATATEQLWQDKMAHEARTYAVQRFKVLKTGWRIYPLSALPTLTAYLLLLTYGLHKIQTGALTIGGFVAMQSYVLLLQMPLAELGDVFADWQTGFASFARVVEILNLKKSPRETSAATVLPDSAEDAPAISIRHLSIAFGQPGQEILQNVTFSAARGEKIGIMGPIGSGKSTLLNVMAGLLGDFRGEVAIFGRPLASMSSRDITQHVALVPQRTFLFGGTIRDNLLLDAEFSSEQIWQVLDTVQLTREVSKWPLGLDSRVGEGGVNLSGGQKQRLALARALLRPAPILLLDDCLSAVDAMTEELILTAMTKTFKDQTIIWVAHRASTLALCQRIYHFCAGAIVRCEKRQETQHGE